MKLKWIVLSSPGCRVMQAGAEEIATLKTRKDMLSNGRAAQEWPVFGLMDNFG